MATRISIPRLSSSPETCRAARSGSASRRMTCALLVQLVPEIVEAFADLAAGLAHVAFHLAAEALVGALILQVHVAAGAADVLLHRPGCFVDFAANFIVVG